MACYTQDDNDILSTGGDAAVFFTPSANDLGVRFLLLLELCFACLHQVSLRQCDVVLCSVQ